MVVEIIKQGFMTIAQSFGNFQGTGLMFILFLTSVLYVAYSRKDSRIKDLFVKYPLYVLAVFFCPAWYVYIYYASDYEILYRILWLLPIGIILCYVLVDLVYRAPEKHQPLCFVIAVLFIILSGKYIYSSEFFSPAENEYHVPDIVVELCEEIKVEGREIRVAVPDELISYVKQYSAVVCLPYGRDTIMGYNYDISDLRDILETDVIDTAALAVEMRGMDTPYLLVKNDRKFSESLSDYNFVYVTSYGEYDMYLDDEAYTGIDYINYR